MPVLLESSSHPGEHRKLSSRSWWDVIDQWIKDHSGQGGHTGGSGNSGGHSTTSSKPTTAAPKPTTHTTNPGNGGGGGGAAPSSSSSSNGGGNSNTTDKGNAGSSTSKPTTPKPSSSESPAVASSTSTPAQQDQSSPAATPSGVQTASPTQPVQTGIGLSQSTTSADPSASSGIDDPEVLPAGRTFNPAAVLVPLLVLAIAFGAIIFAVWWHRRRRRKPRALSLHSNATSTYSVVQAPSVSGATAGATSARTSVAGGLLLPPRGGTRPVGMDEIAESRPVSLSSSAFGLTNPFADRAGGTTVASTPWGSDAGHSTNNLAAHRPSQLYSSGHSIVGSGDFSTASAHHGHGGHSLSPTPGPDAANPLGTDARISGGPNLSHTRLVYPSLDDMAMSEDGHVSQYGAAVASSVGHGTHEDARSMTSYNQTPTSLFFRLSQDGPNSLRLTTEPVPPLPQHLRATSPISPETPNSAAPLLGVAGPSTPSPVWMRRSAAPSPPPCGPLPRVPSPLAHGDANRDSVYGGLEEENGSQTTIVQLASRAPMQAPVFMSAPPSGRKDSSPSAESFNAVQLRRSPSVLTTGSDEF